MDEGGNSQFKLNSDPIGIGKWTFYPDLLKLEREDRKEKLEPRAAQLLLYFTRNPDKACTRQSLIENAWPNRVVGDEVLTTAVNKLRKALGDDSHNPLYIETIPKVGYRFVAEVKKLEKQSQNEAEAKLAADKEKDEPLVSLKATISIAVVILVSIALVFLLNDRESVSKPPFQNQLNDQEENPSESVTQVSGINPSIAVLPFVNISEDVDQEYFVDGITEDIITDLSRISSLRVLARNTTFRYKGQSLDLNDIANELNVSHILEGSVRKVGNNLRISARLFDASTAQSLWAERYDRKLEGVFKVQDDVTHNIVTSLRIQLSQQDLEVLESPTTTNFEAYDLFLKGQRLQNERTRESNFQAQQNFRNAIKLDSSFARAYGALSVALLRAATGGYTQNPQEVKDQALEYARKSTLLDNKSQNAFWALSFVHLYRQEYMEAAREVQKALIVAPSYADGIALKALIQNHLGNAEESIQLINRAILLNPYYSWDYLYNLGWAEYTLGNYEKAVELLQRALERNENARPARLMLTASLVAIEEQEDAEWEIEQVLTQFPTMTLSKITKEMPMANEENMKLYVSRLRQAGMPE